MLENARDRVAVLKAEGKSLAEVIAAKPTAATDDKLGKAFINPAQFVTQIYNTL